MDQQYLCDRLCASLESINERLEESLKEITYELKEVNRNLYNHDISLDSIKASIDNYQSTQKVKRIKS
jgi:uncharacterized protein (UPF0335 family)